MQQTGPEVINKNGQAPQHSMRFDYCGGWGYKPKAIAAIEEIEKVMPGQFTYYLMRDNGATGRLEVTVYPNQTTMGETGEGEFVHSKATSKAYIAPNYGVFIANIQAAISKWKKCPLVWLYCLFFLQLGPWESKLMLWRVET